MCVVTGILPYRTLPSRLGTNEGTRPRRKIPPRNPRPDHAHLPLQQLHALPRTGPWGVGILRRLQHGPSGFVPGRFGRTAGVPKFAEYGMGVARDCELGDWLRAARVPGDLYEGLHDGPMGSIADVFVEIVSGVRIKHFLCVFSGDTLMQAYLPGVSPIIHRLYFFRSRYEKSLSSNYPFPCFFSHNRCYTRRRFDRDPSGCHFQK